MIKYRIIFQKERGVRRVAGRRSTLHRGHRDRMREAVRQNGTESLQDHELLEMLLYHAIPRRDTNETAHELIEECGSLSAVLDAAEPQLAKVPYAKGNVALYLRLLRELAHRYTVKQMSEVCENGAMVYDTPDKVAALLYPRFIGLKNERLYVLLLDNSMRLIDLVCVAEGTVSGAPFSVRGIAERAYLRGAAAVILAHNHPGGTTLPSGDDMKMTRQIATALDVLEIPLIEHYVFAGQNYSGLLRDYLSLRAGQEAPVNLSEVLALRRRNYGGFKN